MNEAKYGRRDPANVIFDRLGPAPKPDIIVPLIEVKLSSISTFIKKVFRRLR